MIMPTFILHLVFAGKKGLLFSMKRIMMINQGPERKVENVSCNQDLNCRPPSLQANAIITRPRLPPIMLYISDSIAFSLNGTLIVNIYLLLKYKHYILSTVIF